ncbi:MAG: tubulin-like doman-containing protein [Haloplanus sp.]
MVTHPTFVVGAGQAGINVMRAIDAVARQNGEADRFAYAAIDTDVDTLNRAPDDARRYNLSIEDDFLGEDRATYPYLTRSMNIEGKGAKRQRPVGRYKLDNRGEFDSTFKSLWRDIESHYDSVDVDLGPETASFNIFYVHSHGGGTGSGTYPLLAGMLNTIADDLGTDHVYMAGVGVLPMIPFPGDDSPVTFPGRPIYYPNAYAALKDLEQFELLEIDDTATRELLVQSKRRGGTSGSRTDVESFTFEHSPPFDDYWLVGVDEGKIQGGLDRHVGPESYRGELNQTIARGLHAITQFSTSAENWTQGRSVVGTLDQSTVSVPHEEVQAYCEQKSERNDRAERKDEEIPAEIERLESRKAEIEALKSHLDPEQIADEELKRDLERRLEQDNFYTGADIIDRKSPSDIEQVLADIAEDHPVEGEIIATNILEEKLQEQQGVPQVEQEHEDVVQHLWSKYNMQTEPGGSNVRTLEGKASKTKEHLEENIEEQKELVESWDPALPGKLQDWLPPLIGIFESNREHAEAVVEELQSDYDQLERIQSEWGRVSRMKRAVADHKQSIRDQIDDQIDEKNRQISELQAERESLADEIEKMDREIESKLDDLTDADLGKRVAVLPLKQSELEAIDPSTVDEVLDSLSAYVEEGLVDSDKVRRALSSRFEFARAWENRIIDGDMAGANYEQYQTDWDEMWILHEDANEGLVDRINTVASGANETKQPGGDIQALSDPYRVEFVSFSRRGPVSRLKIYQVMDDLADRGDLDDLAGLYDDYRQAFAYPEWYGRDVQEAFDITDSVEVTFPPEMDDTRVDKPDLSEGERKNFIKTNGLDSYVWEGMMWSTYEATDQRFTGWKERLTSKSVTFTDLQKSTPSPDLKAQWLSGQADWEDVVEAYRDNLIDERGVELQFEA